MADVLDALQVPEPQRSDALRRMRDQLDRWQLAVPPVEPLVMDFGLGDFDRTGLIECWIANEVEAGYCGKYMFLFAGQRCPAHAHAVKHETFAIVRGRIRLTVDGTVRELGEGEVLPVPPGCVHEFEGVGNTLILELSMPCVVSDNQFQDERVAAWLRGAVGEAS